MYGSGLDKESEVSPEFHSSPGVMFSSEDVQVQVQVH
jgi:hypothetical protein